MSMKIITGSTGTTHVTSNNDGEFNEALFGKDLVILPNGNKLAATIIDNNTIQVADGDLILQGRHALIEPGTNELVTIETGSVDYNRIDLIVAHYELNSETGYESLELKVIKGAQSSSTPRVPSITTGDIRTGATIAEAILYQVDITGISITGVTRKVNVAPILLSEVNDCKNQVSACNTKVSKAIEIVSFNSSTGELVTRTMQ